MLCRFVGSGKTRMANIFGKGSFLLPGLLGFYNTQQWWFPSALNGWYDQGKQERSTWSQRVRNPGSSFIHIIVVMLLMTINRGTKSRNVLTYTIIGGAGGALHQLLGSISRESFYYWLTSVIVCLGLSGILPTIPKGKSNSKHWTSRSNSKNNNLHEKKPQTVQEKMGKLKDHNWVQKVAFDLCTGSQRCCFTGLNISNNFTSPSVIRSIQYTHQDSQILKHLTNRR